MRQYPEALLATPLLANLRDEQRLDVLAAAVPRTLDKGQFLFHEGDPTEGFFVLASGSIKLVRFTAQGKEMLVHMVRPGQTFAEAAVFGPSSYPASAVAVEASEVWMWPQQRLLSMLRDSPELALALILSVSIWTRHLVGKLELLTQRRVEERLAIYILGRAGGRPLASGDEVVLDEAKQLIAAQIGTAPEVLSRTFKRLEDDGILAVDGDRVRIQDSGRFAVLAELIEV